MSVPYKSVCWLQLVPHWRGTHVTKVTVARVTQSRPRDPFPDAALLRLELTVPTEIFEPLRMHVVVEENDVEIVPRIGLAE